MFKEIPLKIAYSYESGDPSLPMLKELVSNIPDSEKSKILSYLRCNCILCSPGMIENVVEPGSSIGSGNVYTDGIHSWNDAFINYVDRYNIPVPAEFRSYILKHYGNRMKRHTVLRNTDCIELESNPYLGYRYDVMLHRSGMVRYRNQQDCDDTVLLVPSEKVQDLMNHTVARLYCYDYDTTEQGTPTMDGYHWKLTFYHKGKVIDTIEGWPGEPPWRRRQITEIAEHSEHLLSKDLGSRWMRQIEQEENDVMMSHPCEDWKNSLIGFAFCYSGNYVNQHRVTVEKTENGYFATEISFKLRTGLARRRITQEQWQSFADKLFDEICLHEWQTEYKLPYDVLDGDNWSVRLCFTKNRERKYHGANVYPPQWSDLVRLLERMTGADERG